jgi:predicted dehydrogenase
VSQAPLRLGVLGAARIAPQALLKPARRVAEATVIAVAARDRTRAEKFARKHGIPRVHGTYDGLLADPEIDAVYNPLPNGLHCEWTLRALKAGKHVLCEKPIAANAVEAEQMAEAAQQADRVLVEAFHWRYHPMAARMREVVRKELGSVEHIDVTLCIPLLIPGDIRYRFDLAGGATMDAGCYTINILRWLAEAEPEVVSAEARLSSPNVDRWMRAEMRFADGRTGRITTSLASASLLKIQAIVRGSEGEMRVFNPVAPHIANRLTLRTARGTHKERVRGEPTYTGQLRAFVAHVRGGPRMSSDPVDAIANMRVIDAVYEKAGLPLRG